MFSSTVHRSRFRLVKAGTGHVAFKRSDILLLIGVWAKMMLARVIVFVLHRVLRVDRIDYNEDYKLSDPQRAVFALERKFPGSSLNNIAAIVPLKAKKYHNNVELLRQAISLVYRSHDAMNVQFTAMGSEPKFRFSRLTQRTTDAAFISFAGGGKKIAENDDMVDETLLQALQELRTRVSVSFTVPEYRYLRAFSLQPFNLKHSLYRVSLVETAAGELVMAVCAHHTSTDGFDFARTAHLIDPIFDLLVEKRLAAAMQIRLPLLSYPFVMRLEESYKASPSYDGDKAFWLHKFQDGVPKHARISLGSLGLQNKLANPQELDARTPFQCGNFSFVIQDARIQDVCCDIGASPFRLLLASFAVTVMKLTGEEDLVFGIARHNRDGSIALACTEGLLATLVPVRLQTNMGSTFQTFLQTTLRSEVRGVKKHGKFPMLDLLHLLRRTGALNAASPLYDIIFSYEPTMADVQKGVLAYALHLEAMAAMEVHVRELKPDKFDVHIVFRLADYDRATVVHLCEIWKYVNEAMLSNPSRRFSALSLATEVETKKILHDFIDTSRPYPSDRCIHELIIDQVFRCPDARAVIFQEDEMTYIELYESSRRLALHLFHHLKLKPDDCIGLCMERSFERMVAVLASHLAGGAYVPLDPEYSSERLQYMIHDSNTKVVITQGRFLGKMKALVSSATTLICLDDPFCVSIDCQEDEELNAPVKPHNLAYVMYTSESTVKPKGVMIEHKALVNRIHWIQDMYGMSSDDAIMQKTNFCFDLSAIELFWPLTCGATLVMASPGGHKDVEYLNKTIRRYSISTLQFVPSMLGAYLQAARDLAPCETVRKVICAGEDLPHALTKDYRFQFPKAQLINNYGPTETGEVSSFNCEALAGMAHPQRVPIGKPISNTHFFVVDRSDQLVPVGATGELLVAGDSLARGYINNVELTEAKFIKNNTFVPGTRVYRTGDMVRWLPDGNLECLGRNDSQVKVRGFRIELGEVEGWLRQQVDLVKECAVVAQGQGTPSCRLVAFYVAAQQDRLVSATCDDEAIKKRFRGSLLADYMIPSLFVAVESIPLNQHGKIDRKKLLDLTKTCLSEGKKKTLPRTETERIIASIWKECLQVSVLGIEDNFFDLGGHSLLAIEVASRLKEALKQPVTPRLISDTETLHKLAEVLEKGTSPEVQDLRAEIDAYAKQYPLVPGIEQTPEGPPSDVLLTGATGFVGAHLLEAMFLKYPNVRLHCLIRARSNLSVEEQLRTSLQRYIDPNSIPWKQIVLIPSDLTKERLGQSEEAFQCLSKTIDAIVHVAAKVDHLQPYHQLASTNVLGTLQLLQLAAVKRVPFHFVSSIGVFVPSRDDAMVSLPESFDVPLPHFQHASGYSQSKWVAEQVIARVAEDHGLPVRVYRPGLIIGHSQTGTIPTKDYWFTMALRACYLTGAIAPFPFALHGITVDAFCRALVDSVMLFNHYQPCAQVFNLTDGLDVSSTDVLQDCFAQTLSVGAMQPVTLANWLERVRYVAIKSGEQAMAKLANLLEEAMANPSGHATAVTSVNGKHLLAQCGAAPKTMRQVLERTLKYLQDRGFFERPDGHFRHQKKSYLRKSSSAASAA